MDEIPRNASQAPREGRLTWYFSERATGIEPAFSAWEADVLPLNYTRVRHCNLPKLLLTAPSGLSAGASVPTVWPA